MLDETNYSSALQILSAKDAILHRVIERCGTPPIWIRPAGFAALIHILLEQQVSIASALASFEKLQRYLSGKITPETLLELSDSEFKNCGFSRQKILYAREIAAAIIEKRLNLDDLENLSDDAVKTELTKIKGVGRWTADIYLLMCLRRADAFPVGDLGVVIGIQKLKNLETRPTAEELEKIGGSWKPYRAVATRIIWQFYLNQKLFNQ